MSTVQYSTVRGTAQDYLFSIIIICALRKDRHYIYLGTEHYEHCGTMCTTLLV